MRIRPSAMIPVALAVAIALGGAAAVGSADAARPDAVPTAGEASYGGSAAGATRAAKSSATSATSTPTSTSSASAAPASVQSTTPASAERGGAAGRDHGGSGDHLGSGGRSDDQQALLAELHRGQVPAEVAAMLRSHASSYRWAGAAVGSTQASAMQLTSGVPVMEVGGFAGLYPAPTLQQFEHEVREHRIHYFVSTIVGPPVPHDAAAMRISRWVAAHWTPTRRDGFSLYDVAAPERDQGTGITPPV